MYASGNRKKFARNLLTPIFQKETACRPVVHAPTHKHEKCLIAGNHPVVRHLYACDGTRRGKYGRIGTNKNQGSMT
jgi:hypothetical protein